MSVFTSRIINPMVKQSAGLLVYRVRVSTIEVLLGHPGGPFYAKKDDGVWSIPKGEYTDEDPLSAAKREFKEETGWDTPEGQTIELGSSNTKGGKTIYAWAVEGDLDAGSIKSNSFTMEWPPKSGNQQEFPEIDRAGWFELPVAAKKITNSQLPFLERLSANLLSKYPDISRASNNSIDMDSKEPEQSSLF